MRQATSERVRALALGAGLAAALVVASWAGTAVSNVCAPALPPPLAAICQNEPIGAATMNRNFQALIDAHVSKTGPLGSPLVALPSCSDVTNSATSSGGGNSVSTWCPSGQFPIAVECSTTNGALTQAQGSDTGAGQGKLACSASNTAAGSVLTVNARCCAIRWGG